MLVLTRREGESIIINNEIKVTILKVRGKQVKIGTEAPNGMSINRLEIKKASEENEEGTTGQ